MRDTIAQRKARGCERLTRERDNAIKRAEAAEARAMQTESELRAALSREEYMRLVAESSRDELRRQLSEAQNAIDVLSNTVVAQDATIKQLEQAREDVAEYRAEIEQARHEIERLNRFLQTIVNIGDKDHHAAFDGERWRQMRHCANQGLNTKNEMYEP